uniref:Uncharacterized protein n=1 Tax=Desertifilum tharense IPPAS B-1220 TaxID=1781255 RepID=A0ACD5GVQ9_9CYAN
MGRWGEESQSATVLATDLKLSTQKHLVRCFAPLNCTTALSTQHFIPHFTLSTQLLAHRYAEPRNSTVNSTLHPHFTLSTQHSALRNTQHSALRNTQHLETLSTQKYVRN